MPSLAFFATVSFNWGVLIKWVLANTIGITVSVPIAAVAVLIWGTNLSAEMVNIVLALIVGVLLGIFQWFVLRSEIEITKWWVLNSCVGLAIGIRVIAGANDWLFSWESGNIYSYLLIGTLIGAAVGIAQWLVLRQQSRYSILWILGSVIGCALGLAWGKSTESGGGDSEVGVAIVVVVMFLKIMITYSTFTGVLLSWLTSHPLNNKQSTA